MPGNTKKHRRGNNEGSIYQRKDGKWAAVLTVGVKPDGKANRKFLYGKTRKEVADKLREAQNKLDFGVLPGGDSVVFEKWIRSWLEVMIRPGVKDRTYKNYSTAIEKHIIPGLGRYRLKDLNDDIIQAYLNQQQKTGNLRLVVNEETGEPEPCHGPVAPSSIIQQRRLIIAALEYAVDKGKLTRNPGKKTRRPKAVARTGNILSDADMEILATKGTKYRYYPAYMLTLTTACRRGEVLGLSWKHIDVGVPWATVDRYFPWGEIKKLTLWDTAALKRVLAENSITMGDGYIKLSQQLAENRTLDDLKTALSRRSLIITEEMVLILVFWRMVQNRERRAAEEKGVAYNPDDLVFTTRNGTCVRPGTFTSLWKKNLASMGIEHKRFHDLRHTVATIMLEDGEAVNTVQEQLGHYDAGFTASRYGHVTAKMKTSAAVKLGERLKAVRGTEETPEDTAEVISITDAARQPLKLAAWKIK